MGTRETILRAVAANKPAHAALPDIDISVGIQYPDVIGQFINAVAAAGGKAFYEHGLEDLLNDITAASGQNNFVINLLSRPDIEEWKGLKAAELMALHTCYLQAQLAVAENGAMWISEKQVPNRLLPFICQHLVIVVDPDDIVNNMHEAYQQLGAITDGFGVFIAGPSKTADIEQNLVIGAHGARSLRVYLISNDQRKTFSGRIS